MFAAKLNSAPSAKNIKPVERERSNYILCVMNKAEPGRKKKEKKRDVLYFDVVKTNEKRIKSVVKNETTT